jgi:transposase
MQANQVYVGVDVAKATLVIGIHGTATRQRLANDEAQIERWLETLPAEAVVAMESTGSYHQALARLTHRSGRTAYVLNAKDVYFYAKALGARSKTDRVDAQVIARYAAEHHASLHAWSPGSQAQEQVQALVQRRARIGVHRVALRELLRGLEGLQPAWGQLEAQFDDLLAQIDCQIEVRVTSEPQLDRGRQRLRTITGVGPQGSALLAALMSRIAFANADALVAYSGLDPRANDSGSKNGRRRLTKRGNADLRRQMYLAAFSAARSKALGPMYRAIKARGFKPTEALVILARKLLRVAWAVWKSGKPFDPTRFLLPASCAQT